MIVFARPFVGRAALLLGVLAWQPVLADDSDLEARLEALKQTVLQQQAELDAQREQMVKQLELIQQLQEALRSGASSTVEDASAEVSTHDGAAAPEAQGGQGVVEGATAAEVSAHDGAAAPEAQDGQVVADDAATPAASNGQEAAEAELTRRKIEGTADKPVDSQATLYDPSNSIFDPDFQGAWHLPGTTAAMKIGGFVNLAVVDTLDPMLQECDRFVVGYIPVEGQVVTDPCDGMEVTANQSRVNFEVREHTTRGMLRAFVEGDFLGAGDTFRLRHAYGEFAWALAGKTWSVFTNVESLPEMLDFEGINGAVLVRQPQLRVFPKLGAEYSLIVSLEDPETDIENGTGEQGLADFVVSVDRVPLGGSRAWNYRVALILRDLEGTENPPNVGPTQQATGWGITTSGRQSSLWGGEDSVLWQLTYGEGVGRYLNDLATVGGGDAVFDPNGDLRPLPVFGGFLSYQHEWDGRFKFMSDWPGLLRSNLNFSWINIDNFDFQSASSYNSTLYTSVNLIYFPTQNARVGIEYLWGERTNKDNSTGTARQIQIGTRYSF